MAITADQRATLQLLLERGQSYADLARLLGQHEAEVRARARAALTELGGADPDRNVGLTDYLLGQADPIGRADAVPPPARRPRRPRARLRALRAPARAMFPNAELPRLPGEPRPAAACCAGAAGPGAPPRTPRRPRAALSRSQTRLIVVLGSAAVLLIAVVLAVTGAFGGGDDEGERDATGETTTTARLPDRRADPARSPLRPVAGGDASGTAVFGLATGDQPYVDIAIRGLDPAPQRADLRRLADAHRRPRATRSRRSR